MAKNPIEILEQQECIQKLIDKGYGSLVDALLENENQCYTKKARLNKSGTCRVLGYKNKQLEDALKECRAILESEFDNKD